jgi:PPOX class probable F420-dependent enzyme
MNLRKQIELTPDEVKAFVGAAYTIHLCTHGPHGYPHVVPMWFAVDDDLTVWMTTFRKSQKAANIRRNPKVALLVESGTTYEALKGVLIRGDAALIDDADAVVKILTRVHTRMSGSFPEGVEPALRAQAQKRVAIKVSTWRVSSWDHAKLSGRY